MKKILLAYDGTNEATNALRLTLDLAKAFGAEVGVVSVIPVHPGRTPVDPWDDRAVHTQQLADARSALTSEGIEPKLHEPAGDPARAIESVVEGAGYDTVILGSRGLGPISRFLQGSVSEHVATHAKADVVIVR